MPSSKRRLTKPEGRQSGKSDPCASMVHGNTTARYAREGAFVSTVLKSVVARKDAKAAEFVLMAKTISSAKIATERGLTSASTITRGTLV